MGDLNTAGRGWVDPLGVPSAEAMVTVGRVAIFEVIVDGSGYVVVAGDLRNSNSDKLRKLSALCEIKGSKP